MQQRFLLQILLLAQHVSGTTMPIIRSCLWYFVLWFSSCWSAVELRIMCPVCRMLLYWLCFVACGPKHFEQATRSAINTSVASSWHFISTCAFVVNEKVCNPVHNARNDQYLHTRNPSGCARKFVFKSNFWSN